MDPLCRANPGRAVLFSMGAHAVLVGVTFFSCLSLLRSLAFLADHDMDYHRHAVFKPIWMLVPLANACVEHPIVPILVACGLLLADWHLCRTLSRRASRCLVARSSLAVAVACLLSLLAVVFAADRYVDEWTHKLDRAAEHQQRH